MFLGLPDPDPNPIVREMYPNILLSSEKSEKNLDFFSFVISFGLFVYKVNK
jgi:hypothetical protein